MNKIVFRASQSKPGRGHPIYRPAGYAHAGYAQSLAEFGTPRQLPSSGGWILERRIGGTRDRDAMGCYPLFACQDWSRLGEDLDQAGADLVCLSLVTDPYGEFDLPGLQALFPDLVLPFKLHYTVDLSQPLESFVSSHHRRNARKGLSALQIERCTNPQQHLEHWVSLYAHLVHRHHIRGMSAFSRQAFARQLALPGMVAFRAFLGDETLGMILWFAQGERAYYHLGAFSRRGYKLRASFALFWTALETFAATGLRFLSLGAGAGLEDDPADGLNRFKRGWSNGTRPAYFCGRIFDRPRYDALAQAASAHDEPYFPAYRAGEW